MFLVINIPSATQDHCNLYLCISFSHRLEAEGVEEIVTDVPDSPTKHPKTDKIIFEPLYQGAQITVCGAYCAILEFKYVCRLPFTAIAMILQLLQLICPPGNKLPQSLYTFKKFFQNYNCAYSKCMLCPSCRAELEPKQQQCQNAGCVKLEPDCLIQIPPKKAIRKTVASK